MTLDNGSNDPFGADDETKVGGLETVFEDNNSEESFEYPEQNASNTAATSDGAPEAEYDEAGSGFSGIVAPEPLPEEEKSKTWIAVTAGVIGAALLAALVGTAVYAANKGGGEQEATPPTSSSSSAQPSVVVPQTTKVTVTQKVPDTSAAKKAEDQRDAIKRDRDRYKDQVGALQRENNKLENKAPRTVTKTVTPPTKTVTKTVETPAPTTTTSPSTTDQESEN